MKKKRISNEMSQRIELEKLSDYELVNMVIHEREMKEDLKSELAEKMEEHDQQINRIMELNDEKLKLEEYINRLKDSINLQDKKYNELLGKAKEYENAFKLLVKEINNNGK